MIKLFLIGSLASIVGPDTVAFGIDTYQVGVTVLSLGLVAFAAVTLWRRVGSPLAAWLWMGSTGTAVLGGLIGHAEAGFVAAGVLFGLAFIAAGLAGLGDASRVEPATAPLVR